MSVVQFFLFVIAILLVSIFWELSRINSRLNKAVRSLKACEEERKPSEPLKTPL